ncbi:MAG: DNA polymerase III subunit delta [Prevotella sp.]|jgi:DNA polymerase-3 subunit delta'|nr:DNA polymerase III subunit delta [Prevotella sp.]MBP8038700.1 DNA polymerase III subunit delta [Prevotella sp.]MBP8757037.1 DNA polymerase III subunit delta [Prevotella sp.]MBP9983665.1 DNA polymerase III subunit delta [Prevotella sp.]MDY0153149.1 DNA polymerase III subunit delta [Prevotella sp.]
MKFSDVIGQEEAINRLRQLVEEQRVPSTMMLCGPSGCGKMALAMAFASYLLGERDGEKSLLSDPMAIRNAEAMLKNWEHPDLHFTYPVIKPAGVSADHKMISDDFTREWHEMIAESQYFFIDNWLAKMDAANQQAIIGAGESDELTRKMSLKSSQGGYKVSIIWLPERMNAECANKLLKLLEEPPHQTVFIMVSEEPELLLDTIKSRTQRIDIKKIDDDAIEKALTERRGLDQDVAHRIARIANGNWMRALENLDAGNENRQFLDMFIMLMRLSYQRNIKELKKWSEIASTNYGREKQRRMLNYFSRMVRENFMYNFQQAELCYMTQEEEDFSSKFARFINEANVIEISELLQKARRDIGQNANGKIVFFDLALQMIVLLIRK